MSKPKPKLFNLQRKWWQTGVLLDRLLSQLYRNWFGSHTLITLAASLVIYACGMLLLPHWLQESVNFFIVLPVVAIALSSGLSGGIVAGLLGLPVNLLLLTLGGHPEFAPKSWWMAELTGIILGTVLGYLSDYFHRVEHEIARRKAAGKALLTSLWERDALLDEMDHRVRNNLNLVRSLIRLQSRRSAGHGFADLVENIDRRIMAIARVYDLLQVTKQHAFVEPRAFLSSLLHEVGVSHDSALALEDCLEYAGDETLFSLENATVMGLIVNEAVSNAWQHGRSPDGTLKLRVSLSLGQASGSLHISDAGAGFDPETVDWGLGLDLIALQVANLRGTYQFLPGAGTELAIKFPGLA